MMIMHISNQILTISIWGAAIFVVFIGILTILDIIVETILSITHKDVDPKEVFVYRMLKSLIVRFFAGFIILVILVITFGIGIIAMSIS